MIIAILNNTKKERKDHPEIHICSFSKFSQENLRFFWVFKIGGMRDCSIMKYHNRRFFYLIYTFFKTLRQGVYLQVQKYGSICYAII
jgi:hypothetical protein